MVIHDVHDQVKAQKMRRSVIQVRRPSLHQLLEHWLRSQLLLAVTQLCPSAKAWTRCTRPRMALRHWGKGPDGKNFVPALSLSLSCPSWIIQSKCSTANIYRDTNDLSVYFKNYVQVSLHLMLGKSYLSSRWFPLTRWCCSRAGMTMLSEVTQAGSLLSTCLSVKYQVRPQCMVHFWSAPDTLACFLLIKAARVCVGLPPSEGLGGLLRPNLHTMGGKKSGGLTPFALRDLYQFSSLPSDFFPPPLYLLYCTLRPAVPYFTPAGQPFSFITHTCSSRWLLHMTASSPDNNDDDNQMIRLQQYR